MRLILTLTLSVLCFSTLSAQEQDKPQPDRWHGLVLEQSTPDDATRSLGAAKGDKTYKGKSGESRLLTFKKTAGMKEVMLAFRGGILVSITLKPEEKINADALPNIYGLKFTPKFSGIGEAMNPQDYERHEGKVYAKTYPAVYELRAEGERSRVECLIDNGSFGAILKQGTGVKDVDGFPGHVVLISLVSKKLDDTKGADVLK
jgi:hypothetical protein